MMGKPISPRQMEVWRLMASGLTNEAIAREMVLSERTVEGYINRLFTKINGMSKGDDYNNRTYMTRLWWETECTQL